MIVVLNRVAVVCHEVATQGKPWRDSAGGTHGTSISKIEPRKWRNKCRHLRGSICWSSVAASQLFTTSWFKIGCARSHSSFCIPFIMSKISAIAAVADGRYFCFAAFAPFASLRLIKTGANLCEEERLTNAITVLRFKTRVRTRARARKEKKVAGSSFVGIEFVAQGADADAKQDGCSGAVLVA